MRWNSPSAVAATSGTLDSTEGSTGASVSKMPSAAGSASGMVTSSTISDWLNSPCEASRARRPSCTASARKVMISASAAVSSSRPSARGSIEIEARSLTRCSPLTSSMKAPSALTAPILRPR